MEYKIIYINHRMQKGLYYAGELTNGKHHATGKKVLMAIGGRGNHDCL